MQTIYERIHDLMISAVKSRDKESANLYKYLKGRFDNDRNPPITDARAITIIHGLIREAKDYRTSFSEKEIRCMEELIPPVLSENEVRDYLDKTGKTNEIKFVPKEGMAIGIAIRALADGHRLVDNSTVRRVVMNIRESATRQVVDEIREKIAATAREMKQ